MQQEPN